MYVSVHMCVTEFAKESNKKTLYLFSDYLLSTKYMPGIVIVSGDKVMNKAFLKHKPQTSLAPLGLMF